MDKQPVKFDSFLRTQKFQQIFRFEIFKFERLRSGRLTCKCDPILIKLFILDSTFFIFNIYDIIRSKKESNQNIAAFSVAVYFLVSGLMLYAKSNDIIDMVNVLDREFPRDRLGQQLLRAPELYKRSEERWRLICVVDCVSLIIFSTVPVAVYLLTYDRSAPITLDQCLLAGWLPFGLKQNHYAYPLVWMYDVSLMVCGGSFYASFDTLFYMMQGQLIMHMEALTKQISAINSADTRNSIEDQQFYDYIGQLINRQQYINELSRQFTEIFKNFIFLEHFVAAMSICLSLYLISEAQDILALVRYTVPAFVLILFTFDTCMRGEQLEEASAKVQMALYNHNWYMGTNKYRKLVLIWLHYSQQTVKIIAYGLIQVNMEHFSFIMQLAYKLFTFLKSRQ